MSLQKALKNGLEECKQRGSFRSMILSYQFVKYLKIRENFKTLQAFDILTKKDVIIKFFKIKPNEAECNSAGLKVPCGNNILCLSRPLAEQKVMYLAEYPSRCSKVDLSDQKANGIKYQKTTGKIDSWIEQSKILPILNHKNIVKQVFNRNFGDCNAICIEHFSGACLNGSLKDEDTLLILKQLISIVDYLTEARIDIPTIKPKDVLINKENEIKLIKLHQPRFVDTISPFMERKNRNCLLSLLYFLINGYEWPEDHTNDISRESVKKGLELFDSDENCSDNTIEMDLLDQFDDRSIFNRESFHEIIISKISDKRLKGICELLIKDSEIHEVARICEVNEEFCHSSNLFIDPAVLLEIKNIGFLWPETQCIVEDRINNTDRKEYYLYRLVEENYIKLKIRQQLQKSIGPLENISRLIIEKGLFNINRLENAECNAITQQEQEKHMLIKSRVSILKDLMLHSSSFRNCMSCGNDDRTYINLQVLKKDLFFDIMRLLRFMKVSGWKIKDKIKIRQDDIGLMIIISMKSNGQIQVAKEAGRNIDFLHLVSELIEVSKMIQ